MKSDDLLTWLSQFRAVIEGSSPPIVVCKDIYIGTVPICLRETRLTSCATVGPLASRNYVTTTSLMTSYDDENDVDVVSYCSPPSGVSRLSLVDFVASTAVQGPGGVTGGGLGGPSAPVPTLHAAGPPPYEARPPPFAPGHEDTSTKRQIADTSSLDQQILQPPRESNIGPNLRGKLAGKPTGNY